jgi:uncharacterized protein YbcV (DUF1398 family)
MEEIKSLSDPSYKTALPFKETAEQLEIIRKIPYMMTTNIEIVPDAKQIIKDAVKAIEDVVEGVYPMCIALPFDASCIHDVSRTKEDGDCQHCIHEYMKETANALKGLIYG